MNIRHIETFVAVVDSGSFSKASQALYTTPTALTQQVNTLERNLGVQLLARDYRGVSPTKAGEAFLPYARDLVRLAGLAERAARDAAGTGRSQIRIGSYRDIVLVQLQQILSGFSQICPDVDVSFVDGDYRNFMSQLTQGDIDLYIHPHGSELDRRGIGYQKLGMTRMSCSMSFDHPLAARSEIGVHDLADCNVIVSCGCGSHVFDGLGQRLTSEEPTVRVWEFSTDNEVWTHVLTQGFVLVNMEYSARYIGSCISVPFAWPDMFEYGIVYKEPCTNTVRRFLNYVATQDALAQDPPVPREEARALTR